MKTISIFILLLLSSTLSLAIADEKCTLLIPFPPGGASEINARSLQIGNNNIDIEYKPGAYGISAINYMNRSKNTFLLSPAMMYSENSPSKDLNLKMNRILFGSSIKIITIKDHTLNDLSNKPLRIGIHNPGSQFEAFAKEIKNKNPKIIIVITGSDVKALPMIMNGDLDVYLSTGPNVDAWKKMFDNIKIIGEIPFNGTITIGEIKLKNLSFAAIFTNGNLSKEEEMIIDNCLDKATNNQNFYEYITKNNIPYIKVDKNVSKNLLAEYIEYLRNHGL